MREAAKDGHTRRENVDTQPIKEHRVFNNPDVVTEGWYPVCKSSKLKPGKADSFLISHQRVVVWRTHEGELAALDAFCPHMGADLGNGKVVDGRIQCYFHQWCYGKSGALEKVHCGEMPKNVANRAWPVEEKYGFIWVFSGPEAPYPVSEPSGLEGQAHASLYLGRARLYAHHQVMMVGGIDLLHFATVHKLDVDFDLKVDEPNPYTVIWKLDGQVPPRGWRGKLANWVISGKLNYHAKVAGGSVVTLTYGPDLNFSFMNRKVPPLHILWGGVADHEGISEVDIFLIAPRKKGLWGFLTAWSKLMLTIVMLGILRDDDVKAFPHMRFNIGRVMKEDASVTRMVKFLNGLPISSWSRSQTNRD